MGKHFSLLWPNQRSQKRVINCLCKQKTPHAANGCVTADLLGLYTVPTQKSLSRKVKLYKAEEAIAEVGIQ